MKSFRALLSLVFLISAIVFSGCATEKITPEEQACSAAEIYGDLIENGDMEAILNRLSENDFCAADFGGQYSFVNASSIECFFKTQEDKRAELRFIRVCHDFGLVDTRFYIKDKSWYCKMIRVVWDEGAPQVSYSLDYPLTELKLTEKAYLIFTCDIPDNTASSDHDGYIEPTTMLRVYARDDKCIEYENKFVLGVGYNYNNLFTETWTTEDVAELCLNDIFLSLYRMENGSYISHFNNPYRLLENSPYSLVPAEEFESLIVKYLRLPVETIRKNAFYDEETSCYPVTIDGVHDGLAKIPEAEVVDVQENEDGSISLTVDALFVEYATDKAFSHVIKLREDADGSFYFVSNELIYTDIIPEHKCLFQ